MLGKKKAPVPAPVVDPVVVAEGQKYRIVRRQVPYLVVDGVVVDYSMESVLERRDQNAMKEPYFTTDRVLLEYKEVYGHPTYQNDHNLLVAVLKDLLDLK